MKKLKSPLRYPGGKSRAVNFLFSPENMPLAKIQEYREPFLGGGSPAIAFSKLYPETPVWVNDKYYNLFCFWKVLRDDGERLAEHSLKMKMDHADHDSAKKLFIECKNQINQPWEDPFEIAWRFFILNKASFSGLGESSSFSKMASDSNWSVNACESLKYYSKLIQNWKITNRNYTELLSDDPNIFVFLDPPYDIKSSLYGKKGEMHKGFDHMQFAEELCKRNCMMMVTYNSNEHIRDWFKGWDQREWDLTYTMQSRGAYLQEQKSRKELLCLNYETPSLSVLEA